MSESAVEAIRASYHLRGWKHMVTTSDHGGPVHNGTTDVWVVLDGANVRGAVVLAETPRSLTLVTVLSLLFFGGPVLHSFALAMLVGIVVGTYSSIEDPGRS